MNQTPTTRGGSDQPVRESLFLYECSLWHAPYGYAESVLRHQPPLITKDIDLPEHTAPVQVE